MMATTSGILLTNKLLSSPSLRLFRCPNTSPGLLFITLLSLRILDPLPVSTTAILLLLPTRTATETTSHSSDHQAALPAPSLRPTMLPTTLPNHPSPHPLPHLPQAINQLLFPPHPSPTHLPRPIPPSSSPTSPLHNIQDMEMEEEQEEEEALDRHHCHW